MKLIQKITAIALAFVMCTGLICTVNANENNGECILILQKKVKTEL